MAPLPHGCRHWWWPRSHWPVGACLRLCLYAALCAWRFLRLPFFGVRVFVQLRSPVWTSGEELALDAPERNKVVFIGRVPGRTRCVQNQAAVLAAIQSALRPRYELVVYTDPKSLKEIHALGEAVALIGPHGVRCCCVLFFSFCCQVYAAGAARAVLTKHILCVCVLVWICAGCLGKHGVFATRSRRH